MKEFIRELNAVGYNFRYSFFLHPFTLFIKKIKLIPINSGMKLNLFNWMKKEELIDELINRLPAIIQWTLNLIMEWSAANARTESNN